MIIYANTPIMNRFFTTGYMVTHKMVNKFCAIYKEKKNLTLGADILDLLKNIESEEVKQIIRINNKRKGINLKLENRLSLGLLTNCILTTIIGTAVKFSISEFIMEFNLIGHPSH